MTQPDFDAMRAQAERLDDLIALFTDDAVYVEPFTGTPRTHEGRAAIERALRTAMESPPPDLRLEVHRIDLDSTGLFSEWTCHSPGFPGAVRGEDRYVLRGHAGLERHGRRPSRARRRRQRGRSCGLVG